MLIFEGCKCCGIQGFFHIALGASITYPSYTYNDWYDLYSLILYPLALNLEIYVITHLFCGLLLDVLSFGLYYTNTDTLISQNLWL